MRGKVKIFQAILYRTLDGKVPRPSHGVKISHPHSALPRDENIPKPITLNGGKENGTKDNISKTLYSEMHPVLISSGSKGKEREEWRCVQKARNCDHTIRMS